MNRLHYRIGGMIFLLAAFSCSTGIAASTMGGRYRGTFAAGMAVSPDSTEADSTASTDSAAAGMKTPADSIAVERPVSVDSMTTILPVPADSAAAPVVRPLWTVEDLDSVLTRESGADIPEGLSWRRKKNARVAMLCALLFPGLGQIYNEKPYKAALVMGVEIFYASRIMLNYRYAEREEYLKSRSVPGSMEWRDHDVMVAHYKETMIDWIWWSAGAMLIIVLDAYVDAHLHDMNFEVEGRAIEGGAGVSLGFAF